MSKNFKNYKNVLNKIFGIIKSFSRNYFIFHVIFYAEIVDFI